MKSEQVMAQPLYKGDDDDDFRNMQPTNVINEKLKINYSRYFSTYTYCYCKICKKRLIYCCKIYKKCKRYIKQIKCFRKKKRKHNPSQAAYRKLNTTAKNNKLNIGQTGTNALDYGLNP